jgi:peptidyl-prolyl cis-trans isomerase B (cyclophilin B)
MLVMTKCCLTLIGLLGVAALTGCQCGSRTKPAAPAPRLDARPAPTPAQQALLMEQGSALDQAWLSVELKHADPARRARAALAVGRIGRTAADAGRIVPLLRDAAPEVRRQVAFALGLLARRRVDGGPLEALRARLPQERDPAVRRTIAAAVKQVERDANKATAERPKPLAELDAALGDWRPPVQVEAIRSLVRTPAGALRVVERLPRIWRSVSSNHFRLTGPEFHPVMVALEGLRPHAALPQVRSLATELLDLTDATDAAVKYGAKEALSVDRVHCAVAALHDLAAGKLERTPSCGTAGSKLLTPAMRRAFVARLIPALHLAPALRLAALKPYLDDGEASVRRVAAEQLHRLGLDKATLTTEVQRALGRDAANPEAAALPAAPPWLKDLLPSWSRLPRRAQVVFSKGVVTVALDPEQTPAAVARLAWLAKQKVYHRTSVQQVRPFEAVRGGDPQAVGKPAQPPARGEPTPRPVDRGAVLFESPRPGVDGVGLVFVLKRTPALDGARTQLGQVTEGLKVLERLQPGDPIKAVYVFWPKGAKKQGARAHNKGPSPTK